MPMMAAADIMTILAGGIVGVVLGLIGGGGSVLAVPLLVYGVGVASPALWRICSRIGERGT